MLANEEMGLTSEEEVQSMSEEEPEEEQLADEQGNGPNFDIEEQERSAPNTKKQPKRGIIYLSSLPPYMNVSQIREVFSEYGKIGRVYLQLDDKGKICERLENLRIIYLSFSDLPANGKKSKKRNVANKFTEGWVEFERKSVAKRVVAFLNNKQVSTRKRSKHFDCIWNLKYLSHFKWTHLHERLAYEKAAWRQKLRAEVQLAKKKTNFFTANLDKQKKNKTIENAEFKDIISDAKKGPKEKESKRDRTEFLSSLFT